MLGIQMILRNRKVGGGFAAKSRQTFRNVEPNAADSIFDGGRRPRDGRLTPMRSRTV
jgi:hypothetical protein